ncbi:MAG: hypothetical protein NC099_00780 [Corallococcus sp.]|nr:hypothetical protein [Corallococcus sp.]
MEYKTEQVYEQYLAYLWGVKKVCITNTEITVVLREDNNFDLQAEAFLQAYENAKNDEKAQEILKRGMAIVMNILDDLTHEIAAHIPKIADGKFTWKYDDKTAKNLLEIKKAVG